MRPLGFDWRLSVSILSGLAAKEVVVSTLGILYQADTDDGGNSLVEKIQHQKDPSGQTFFTPLIAFSFMSFILTYFPCVGVVAAIRRESGSWKWAAFVVLYTTGCMAAVVFSVPGWKANMTSLILHAEGDFSLISFVDSFEMTGHFMGVVVKKRRFD